MSYVPYAHVLCSRLMWYVPCAHVFCSRHVLCPLCSCLMLTSYVPYADPHFALLLPALCLDAKALIESVGPKSAPFRRVQETPQKMADGWPTKWPAQKQLKKKETAQRVLRLLAQEFPEQLLQTN